MSAGTETVKQWKGLIKTTSFLLVNPANWQIRVWSHLTELRSSDRRAEAKERQSKCSSDWMKVEPTRRRLAWQSETEVATAQRIKDFYFLTQTATLMDSTLRLNLTMLAPLWIQVSFSIFDLSSNFWFWFLMSIIVSRGFFYTVCFIVHCVSN